MSALHKAEKSHLHPVPCGDIARVQLDPLAHVNLLGPPLLPCLEVVAGVQPPPVVCENSVVFVASETPSNSSEKKISHDGSNWKVMDFEAVLVVPH